jgi:hypothetical protein
VDRRKRKWTEEKESGQKKKYGVMMCNLMQTEV